MRHCWCFKDKVYHVSPISVISSSAVGTLKVMVYYVSVIEGGRCVMYPGPKCVMHYCNGIKHCCSQFILSLSLRVDEAQRAVGG